MVLPPGMRPPPGGGGPDFDPDLPPPLFDLPPELLGPEREAAPPPQDEVPPPIEPGKVLERIERAVSFWSERDSRMDEDYGLYKMAVELSGVDPGLEGEVVVRNIPYTVVQKAASVLSARFPSLSLVAPSEDLRRTAEKVEDLLRWCWEEWDRAWRRRLHPSLLYDLAHFLALRGWAAARLSYDPDLSPPVVLELVDPRTVYPVFGSRGLRYVAVRRRQLVAEVLEEWGEDAASVVGDREEDESVVVEAYYDKDYHAVLVDGVFVKPPTPHGLGVCPWVIAISGGTPVRFVEGDPSSWTAEVGVSLFHGVKQAYRQVNKLLSQLATEVARMANPALLYFVDPDETDEPREISLSPGAINYLIAPKERVDVIRTSPNPADLGPLMQSLLDDLARGSLPPVLWGMGAGEQSGFAITMLSGSARDALQPLVLAIESFVEGVSEMALRLLRDLHQGGLGPVVRDRSGRWVYGAPVTVEEIAAVGGQVIARYRDLTPRDRAAMAQIGAMLAEKRLVSMRTVREEYLGIENPDQENERILEELIFTDQELMKEYLVPLSLARFDPELFQVWLAREARKRLEAKKQEEESRVRMERLSAIHGPEVGPPGQAPHPGVPPVPGMPPQPAPPEFGPEVFDALRRAMGASRGPTGQGPES